MLGLLAKKYIKQCPAFPSRCQMTWCLALSEVEMWPRSSSESICFREVDRVDTYVDRGVSEVELKKTVEKLQKSLTTIKYLIKKELQLLRFYVENWSVDWKTCGKMSLWQLSSTYIELCKLINIWHKKLVLSIKPFLLSAMLNVYFLQISHHL